MNITGNLKQIYLYLKYVFVFIYFILLYMLSFVTEMKTCFIFFINIISVQVNQSALLNGNKIRGMWAFCFVLHLEVVPVWHFKPAPLLFTLHLIPAADFPPD